MRRRIFLALVIGVALSGASAYAQGGAAAQQQQQQQQAPADRVTLEEFKSLRAADKVFVLDVRYQIDRKIKGATHVPLDQLEAHLSELPRDREIVTYCSWPEEHTSARAAQILRDKGYKARALLGGWNAWVTSGGETEPAAEAAGNPPAQNTNARQDNHAVASPNPTPSDGKTPATTGSKTVEATKVEPSQSTAQAPMKSPEPKPKSKHKHAKPPGK